MLLTSDDLELMKKWREEVIRNRTFPVLLTVQLDGERDEYTGNETEGELHEFTVQASVVERQSRIDNERNVNDNGAVVIEGDVWLSIMLSELEPIRNQLELEAEEDEFYDRLKKVEYDGLTYIVVNTDKKGIGIRNRIETLVKRAY